MDPAEIAATDASASVFMKEGIRLLEESTSNGEAALALFDRALELRSRLPMDVPAHAYGLAACWLNRADALARIGGLDWTTHALGAYDEAVALLRPLALDDDVRFPRRLAIAYQNRALVLVSQDPPATADAAATLTEAIAVLEQSGAFDDREHLLAVVWMNLANVHAIAGTDGSDLAARHAAQHAIAQVAPHEREYIGAAQVGLSARVVVCQTIARRLPNVAAGDTMPEEVHEATDFVDEGLSVVRHWEQQGPTPFRNIAADLFRFGARVYIHYQPHFLNEFVRENLDPEGSSQEYVESAEMQNVAHELAPYLS
ncbi:MAG TPA: hypothetical protein VHZ73_04385 [Vicinamibacterales bacterium]|jgi:tetratricopeptide (TPR) repeat protein|nr:hypothetical protein [Vicinamibacterales bacterium]